MPVLHRVVVDVTHMPGKIVLVPDEVFPVSPLPEPSLTFASAALVGRIEIRYAPGKMALDEHPACGEIVIARRERPERVQMIREYHRWHSA